VTKIELDEEKGKTGLEKPEVAAQATTTHLSLRLKIDIDLMGLCSAHH
jgi:hypothetical protein